MLKRIHALLVSEGPALLKWPARLVPFAMQKPLLERVLAQVFKQALADGDLEFLQDHWLKVSVSDLQQQLFISYDAGQLLLAADVAAPDVTFCASLNDLVLIAGRKEDPDSLFFQRRLKIEGNTELGLEVKNLIDSLDLDALPAIMQRALTELAGFVQTGLAHQRERHPAH